MSYFALVPTIVNGKGIVAEVIAAEQDVIDSGVFGDPTKWWQTSYNTTGGVHYGKDGQPDGGVELRANYAGIGYTLDTTVVENGVVGVFYAPQPYPSWVISAPTWEWQAPVPYPTDGGDYVWDEATQSWVLAPTEA
jgi:hypothetical protein